MGKTLEREFSDEPVELNITDVFVPGKSLRHIPNIVRYQDTVGKAYDLFVIAALTAAQVVVYWNLPEILTHYSS